MRTLAAAILLALSAGPQARVEGLLPCLAQDEAKIKELIEKLGEDRIDARDDAQKELTQLGDAVLPHVKKLLESGDEDVRSRARQILADLERRKKMASIRRAPSKVTLEGRDRPAKELLAELARKSGNPIDDAAVPVDAKATISVKDVSFYEALDAICRSNGEIMWTAGARLKILKQKYADYPKRYCEGYAIFITRIEARDTKNFAENSYGQLYVSYLVAWEKGNRPSGFNMKGREIRDDKGNDLYDERNGGMYAYNAQVGDRETYSYALNLYAQKLPDPESKALSEVSAEIQVTYVISRLTLTFADPASKINTTEKSDKLTVTLTRFQRKDGTVLCDLSLAGGKMREQGGLPTDAITIVDKSGKKYRASSTGSSYDPRQALTMHFRFSIPDSVELKDLTIQIPNETHQDTLDATFKDVPLK